MANNPYVNKVAKADGTTIIDISDTTAVAADVASGKYFYLATGEKVEGTASGGGGGGTRTTIVPEQTANYSDRYNQINFIAPLVTGEVYIYTIDGVEAQSMAFDNYGSVAIGSPETTIGFEYASGTMYLSIASSSLRGTHTVKVEQESSGGGGSSATLITKTISANGTYSAEDDSADGYSEVTVNVPSGASNVVTGTFKGTTTGAAMDVDLNYSGTGYPIAVLIFPEEGTANPNGNYYPTLLRGAVMLYSVIKNVSTTAPTYTGGTNDDTTYAYRNKSSTSSASTTGAGGGVSTKLYNDAAATSGLSSLVKIRSNKKLSVYIISSSGSSTGGFMANIDYRYIVYYSS